MLTDEVRHLAITRCFGLALVGGWRAAEQARHQSKPGREDDPPNRAAPEAPSRYFPVFPRSIAMGAAGGTPMARAVLTRTPEGLVVRRPIHSSSVEQFAEKALAAALMAPLVTVLPAMIAMAAIVR